MKLNSFKNFIFGVLIFFLSTNSSYSEKINNIKIIGNERISDEVIILFSDVSVGSEINLDDLNVILKKFTIVTFLIMLKLNYKSMNF